MALLSYFSSFSHTSKNFTLRDRFQRIQQITQLLLVDEVCEGLPLVPFSLGSPSPSSPFRTGMTIVDTWGTRAPSRLGNDGTVRSARHKWLPTYFRITHGVPISKGSNQRNLICWISERGHSKPLKQAHQHGYMRQLDRSVNNSESRNKLVICKNF
jgi:hypothetical protein